MSHVHAREPCDVHAHQPIDVLQREPEHGELLGPVTVPVEHTQLRVSELHKVIPTLPFTLGLVLETLEDAVLGEVEAPVECGERCGEPCSQRGRRAAVGVVVVVDRIEG